MIIVINKDKVKIQNFKAFVGKILGNKGGEII